MKVLDQNTQEKPEITYPTRWGYKLIGRDKEKLKACIKEIMGDKEHLTAPGNASRTGKFHSYNTSCEVASQEERDRIFKAFQDHDDVDMVI